MTILKSLLNVVEYITFKKVTLIQTYEAHNAFSFTC